MTKPNFVTAIMRNQQNHVLMILVRGEADNVSHWSLPGGRVEKGETAHSALIREVQEETGLSILKIGHIAYDVRMQFDDRATQALVYAIDSWEGDINPNDPEDEIFRAEWIPLAEAIAHLQKLASYPPMSEPPIAYLSKSEPAGKQWQYRISGEGAIWVSNDE